MGNSNSSDIENLKKLYSMNNIQLEALRRDLNEQREINRQQETHYKSVINNLLQKQNGIRDKIPENHYNKVNDFLQGVNRDIESKSSPVTNWKPGQPVRTAELSTDATAELSTAAAAAAELSTTTTAELSSATTEKTTKLR